MLISDPASGLPVGTALKFQPVLLVYTPPIPAVALADWASFHGVVLAIAFSDGRTDRVEGSAVLVAPGIALCAWHVVEPQLPRLMSGGLGVVCFGIEPNGLALWHIRKVTHVPETDFAILGLERGSAVRSGEILHQASVTTRFPSVGERVTIYGFRASEPYFARMREGEVTVSGQLLSCAGEVVQHFPTGRDRVMLPWPTIEVACPSWGGMSGGPVVDQTGRLIGLLSSSMSTEAHDGPSYVSHLFPALTARFEGGWPAPLFREPNTLLELDHRLCEIEGRDALSYAVDALSGRVATKYRIWEVRSEPSSSGAPRSSWPVTASTVSPG